MSFGSAVYYGEVNVVWSYTSAKFNQHNDSCGTLYGFEKERKSLNMILKKIR